MISTNINTVGRRKTCSASIYLKEGTGEIIVNKREIGKYFSSQNLPTIALQPLKLLDLVGKFDIKINVKGGGTTGQIEAIRLGISRAIVKYSEDYKPQLRLAGYLTRDPRVVERKKYGRKKARKSFQFSKR